MRGGIDIIDVGEVPTPVFYFAAKKWNLEGGVMITASHNPAEFNGFKILRGMGTIYGDDILELHTLSVEGGLPEPGGGTMTSSDVKEEYARYIAANIKSAQVKDFYDSNVSEAVEAFQRSRGLVADGIAGRQTLIHLNSVNDVTVPRLNYQGEG